MPRLLVINPNTTQSVTDLVMKHVAAAVGAGVELVAATGRFGCAYISTEACYAIATHAALDCFTDHGAGCDGVLLACFGDPGLFALREASPVPVTALAEACMQASADRGKRYSIVTGGERWKTMLERLASSLDLRASLAGVRTTAWTGGEIAADPEAALDALALLCEQAATEDGAQEVILGGAGLAGIAQRIQSRVSVPVLDSVLVGAQIAVQRMAARATAR